MERRGYRSMRLVTDDVHMPRASNEISRRLGEGTHDRRRRGSDQPRLRELFAEYNKFLFAWAADRLGI